jgi:hypothetical protein
MSNPSKALRPLIVTAAVVWLTFSAVGRAIGWLLELYYRTASRLASLVGRLTLLVWTHSWPPLRRALAPIGRFLRRAWDHIGLRLTLLIVRPIGRWGRWLLRQITPPVGRLLSYLRRVGRWAQPVLDRVVLGIEAIEERAARLALLLRHVAAPVARFARRRPSNTTPPPADQMPASPGRE